MRTAAKIRSAIQLHWPLISLVIIVLGFTIFSSLINDSMIDQTVMEMFIRLIVVVGIYIFVGNSGVVSFGHIGFMAIGAYAEAWQTCCQASKHLIMPGLPEFLLHQSVPIYLAMMCSGALAALVAFASGLLLLRLSGTALSIATFAFLSIVQITYSHWDSVTRGTSSIIGIPVESSLWSAVGWVVAAIVVAYLFQRSNTGLCLRAARDDEVAAKASGVSVFFTRLAAYMLSAFFVGLGGALYSHFLGILNPDAFYLNLTFITLAMLVVGGAGSLAGATIGVISISVATELLRNAEAGVNIGPFVAKLPSGSQEMLLGALMLLVLIMRPRGIMGGQELEWPGPLAETRAFAGLQFNLVVRQCKRLGGGIVAWCGKRRSVL